jgi:hypothetical protein
LVGVGVDQDSVAGVSRVVILKRAGGRRRARLGCPDLRCIVERTGLDTSEVFGFGAMMAIAEGMVLALLREVCLR